MRVPSAARMAVVAALLFSSASAHAQSSVRQVPVQGTRLQLLLDELGQGIDVHREQRHALVFRGDALAQHPLFFVARRTSGSATLSLYEAGRAGSRLYQVLPAAAPADWHVRVTFANDKPATALIQLYDESDVLQGAVSHSGQGALGLALAVTDDHGTFHSEPALNSGGKTRLLWFKGTGDQLSHTWLAADTDGDGDFADALFLLSSYASEPVAGPGE
jgi:hypothetical protein